MIAVPRDKLKRPAEQEGGSNEEGGGEQQHARVRNAGRRRGCVRARLVRGRGLAVMMGCGGMYCRCWFRVRARDDCDGAGIEGGHEPRGAEQPKCKQQRKRGSAERARQSRCCPDSWHAGALATAHGVHKRKAAAPFERRRDPYSEIA